MSSKDLAVSVRGLSKSYVIAHNSNRPTNFREVIVDRIRHPLGNGRQDQETFWALKDVDFEIARGAVIGIIGRNGAGKSTLLKILSRITWPTTGEIDIYGRVSSLLEVGTGFHGELTGRENIFLNGTILGMSRGEIKRKFDEIVEFSGVEQFLDTPVKRYSSGMYVRLAFAVAAHLEPEILIVDEVLAVGDVEFQQKCLGRMGEVARAGRTILLVSHNMGSISALCSTGILMRNGRVASYGPVNEVIQDYLDVDAPDQASMADHPGRSAGMEPLIRELRVGGGRSEATGAVLCGDPCEIVLRMAYPPPPEARFHISICDMFGTTLVHVNTHLILPHRDQGLPEEEVRCRIEQVNLVPGRYSLNVAYSEGEALRDHIVQARHLDVVESNFLGTGKLPNSSLAKVVLRHQWLHNGGM
ncbi:MAG: ABC transporter ATP-binding protein [Isosphaeraceae bacterium]